MVAIRDASKLEELKEAIKDVPTQPDILVGDEGAIEVARHSEVDAVVTGIVGTCSGANIVELSRLHNCRDSLLDDKALSRTLLPLQMSVLVLPKSTM